MEMRVTPPKRVASPTWGPPPPCKQALRQIRALPFSVFMFDFRMKRKRAWTFKHDFCLWCKEESMWCKREKLKQLPVINFVFVKF